MTQTLAEIDRDEIVAAIPFPIFRGNAKDTSAQLVALDGDLAVIEVTLFGRSRRFSKPLAEVRSK